MSIENDDNTQQIDSQQQQNDTSTNDGAGAWLDKQIEGFDNDTSLDRPGKTVTDQTQIDKSATEQIKEDNKKPAGEEGNAQQRGRIPDKTQQIQPNAPQTRKYGEHFQTNQRGDIVDSNGTVVAKSGYERSVFAKLFPLIERNEREASTLRTQVEAYTNANTLAKTAGLNIDEHSAALNLMVQWKKSPLETLKTMLQIAQQRGINTDEIVSGGGGFNQAAMSSAMEQLLDARLSKFDFLFKDREAQQQQEAVTEQVGQRYQTFIQQFPDAQVHEDSIANVMNDKNVNEREAYFILHAFAAQNGLDWNHSLVPQVQALQAKNSQTQRPSGDGNNRPLPNMGGRGANRGSVPANERGYANADDSWDSIVAETFAQHGRQQSQ